MADYPPGSPLPILGRKARRQGGRLLHTPRHNLKGIAAFFIATLSICGASFRNGQAARAVIGQDSFSAHRPGVAATALTLSGRSLYAADASGHVFTFDLNELPGAKDDFADRPTLSCGLCGFTANSVTNQRVQTGVSAVSVYGNTVVVADPSKHRVLIWRDASGGAQEEPDVVLGGVNTVASPVTSSTLVQPVSVAYDGKRLFVGDAALHRVLVWHSLPASSVQPADTVLGQPDFSSSEDRPVGADTFEVPAALASDAVDLFVADAAANRILVFSESDLPLENSAIVNAASLAPGPVAPGALITIASTGLGEASASAPDGTVLPTRLAGVEVVFDGTPLPLLSVSPLEVKAQIPYDLKGVSAASLYVRSAKNGATRTSNAVALNVVAANPGLYAFAGAEPRSAVALRSEANAGPAASGSPVMDETPVQPGERVTLWAAGLGTINEDDPESQIRAGVPYQGSNGSVAYPVTASIDGIPAEVVSARIPPGSIGVYEVSILIPPDLGTNAKAQLVVAQSGYMSNIVTLPVRGADQ